MLFGAARHCIGGEFRRRWARRWNLESGCAPDADAGRIRQPRSARRRRGNQNQSGLLPQLDRSGQRQAVLFCKRYLAGVFSGPAAGQSRARASRMAENDFSTAVAAPKNPARAGRVDHLFSENRRRNHCDADSNHRDYSRPYIRRIKCLPAHNLSASPNFRSRPRPWCRCIRPPT